MDIKIQNLSKKYEGNVSYTLKDLNLHIKDLDFCVLLGPSGCGKTTLLRMISGLNSITSGDLLFGDNRVNELAPKDREIAMVFQSYALYPHMNVYQNMAFGLRLAKEKKQVINQRVKDVAKILNISEVLYKKPSDLSGGQRQRVALGRAIARKPKIFLMDEPLSNLDAKLREKMRTEIVRIHQMLGTTSIYVTHDQLEAMTMGTKIVLMNNQTIVQIGRPAEIFEKPNCLFAAKFIGSPSINIVKGKIENEQFISNDGQIQAKVSDKHLSLIKKFGLKNIALGFRPHDLKISEQKVINDLVIKTKIAIKENLGPEMQITCDVSDQNSIVALTQENFVTYHQNLYLNLANDKFHFFDLDSEQRITKNFPALKAKHLKHLHFLKEQKQLSTTKKMFNFNILKKSRQKNNKVN